MFSFLFLTCGLDKVEVNWEVFEQEQGVDLDDLDDDFSDEANDVKETN